jgi:hypothetical protein
MSRPEDARAVGLVGAACAPVFAILVFTPMLAREFARRVLNGEGGVVENAEAAVVFCAFVCTVAACLQRAPAVTPPLRAWLAFLAVGLFYLLGEEISWGQHYFGWATTGWFAAHNDQGETNLHNTSSWFDQKPRAILLLAVIVGGLVHPLVKALRRGRGLFDRPWWFAPPLACAPPALLAVLGGMPKRLSHLGLGPPPAYYHAAEVEELFFYIFGLVYAASLLIQIRAMAKPQIRLSGGPAAGPMLGSAEPTQVSGPERR